LEHADGAGAALSWQHPPLRGWNVLNDVCDFKFDAEFRRERPIVTGAISRRAAIIASTILFIAGIILISTINNRSGLLAIGLTLLIVAYDWSHKRIRTAPLLMASCRFLLYLTAAAAGLSGITPRAVIFGATLGIYVTGLSYIARGESRPVPTSRGLWLLLFFPAVAGLALHPSLVTALVSLPLIVLIGWTMIVSLENVGRAVALLLAGIVLVDLIAIRPQRCCRLLAFSYCSARLFVPKVYSGYLMKKESFNHLPVSGAVSL
jgi:4-hydroxybenzoate polyprenyltransferase